ncbi:MAG: response regulator [Myxococcales bacterium]|nr:response regulator [Myxococcales bacterium]
MQSLEAIARLLAERRALPEPLLRRAQNESKSRAAFLGTVLSMGVPEPDLVAMVAEQLGIPGVDLSRTSIDLDVLDAIPRIVAESDLVLPLSSEGGRLHIAISAGVEDDEVLEELRFITAQEVSPYAALPGALEQAIAACYDAKERGERFWRAPGLQVDAEASVAVILPGNKPGRLTRLRTEEIFDSTQDLEELRDELAVEIGHHEDDKDAEVLGTVQVRVGPAHILVVDDDGDILRLLDKTLRAAGHVVDLAHDGREAEARLKTGRYDLVLLDAMLPHVHGFEICARMKASAKTRRVPVILLSAVYRGWRYAHDARESFGADDYIEKPFHLPELLRRVQHRLSGGSQPPPASDKAEKLYHEGMGLLDAKKTAEARAVLEKAVKEDPFSARAQFALARTMHEQGDLFYAITAYERAIELRPNLFQALRAVATLYEQKGFRRKAAEALERAVHSAPDVQTRDALRARLIKLL